MSNENIIHIFSSGNVKEDILFVINALSVSFELGTRYARDRAERTRDRARK